MGLFGRARDDAEEPRPRPRQVFEPQPLDEGEAPPLAPAADPAPGKPARKKPAAKKPRPKKKAAAKATFTPKAPDSGLSANERRLALNAQMAELTEAYKDEPLEKMEAAIKQTLALHDRAVPDDWVATIAEGLRKNGPTTINFGGPKPG